MDIKRIKLTVLAVISLSILLCAHGHAQENMLIKNQELIKNLVGFDWASDLNNKLIRYQKIGAKTNYGFGVASRQTGNVIFPAQGAISYAIASYGKYIAIPKRNLQNKIVYGLINDAGELILDFKYDKIGSTVVPFPDTLIAVQLADKFGVFNTKTGILSAIKYDNTNYVLNDGYSWHEGGAHRARKIIYSQLGISEKYYPEINPVSSFENKAKIVVTDSGTFLADKNGKRLSNVYDRSIRLIVQLDHKSFYLAKRKDPARKNEYAEKFYLLSNEGLELAEMTSENLEKEKYYIELARYGRYYFPETNKIVEIPPEYEPYVKDYAKDGFLGFKNERTGQRFFVDKYGNQQVFGDPPVPKAKFVTDTLTAAVLRDFKKLETAAHRLGRVTKYSYNNNGTIKTEIAFEFDVAGKPQFRWEENYFYNQRDAMVRQTRKLEDGVAREINFRKDESKNIKTYNDKKQLIKTFFKAQDYTYEERMVYDRSANLVEKTTFSFGMNDGTSKFTYNAKNKLVEEKKYVKGKLFYTYKTSYDVKGRKIRFDMIDADNLLTGVWLYQYNADDQLTYQIDLYQKMKEKKLTVIEVSPPPPLPPKKANK